MDLDKIIIALRPRTNEEAIDLGFALARRYYWSLLFIWLVGALPVAIIAYAVLWDHKFWALLIVWWLKPWYERQQLYYLGLKLFDQPISLREAIKGYWARDRQNILWSLTFGRLSIARSFNAAVSLLEGLSGKSRKTRLQSLHRQGNSPELLLFMCSILELMIALTPISLMFTMVPPELLQFVDWQEIIFTVTNSSWVIFAIHVCVFLAMALVSVFFTASGFALYINRRTHLEGWDIELQFRQIAAKAKSVAGCLVTGVLAGWLALGIATPTETWAQDHLDADRSRQQIAEVLADDAFGKTMTISRWVKNDRQERSTPQRSLPTYSPRVDASAGSFLKLISMLVIITAVAIVVLFIARNTRWLDGGKEGERRRADLPVEVFGLSVDEESLPDDVSSVAMRLVDQGDYRGALSLLYRASLSKLMNRGDVVIDDASTEGECLRQVRGVIGADSEDYFAQLTRGWQRQAYAHESLSTEQITRLVQRWQSFLAGSTAAPSSLGAV